MALPKFFKAVASMAARIDGGDVGLALLSIGLLMVNVASALIAVGLILVLQRYPLRTWF